MQKMIYHLGVDIGSTTIKFVVLDEKERIILKIIFAICQIPALHFYKRFRKSRYY